MLGEIIDEKKAFYGDKINIDLKDAGKVFAVNVDIQKFKSIVSNIVNNSVEAGAKKMEIGILGAKNSCTIYFADDGSGFPEGTTKKIGLEEISSKTGGFGIGLSSGFREIEEWGGSLVVRNGQKQGAEIQITLPHEEI